MARIVLILLLLSVFCLGQADVPPASRPAAAPTTLPADASTPLGSLRLLFAATDAGDDAGIRARLYTAGPLEERMADATARLSAATSNLYKAMLRAFGPKETHSFLPDPVVAARNRDQQLPLLVETISPDGQTAVVQMDRLAKVEPFEFRKVGNEWKWRFGKKLETVPAAEVEREMAMLEIQVRVWNDLASDVSAGKLKTVADVRQTMEARVRQANMEYVQSLSKSATRPGK